MLFLRSPGHWVEGAFSLAATTTVGSALFLATFLPERFDVFEHLVVAEMLLIVLQEDLLPPPEPHQEGERGHEPGPHSLNLVVISQLVLRVLVKDMRDGAPVVRALHLVRLNRRLRLVPGVDGCPRDNLLLQSLLGR